MGQVADLQAQVRSLQTIVENMATKHIVFGSPDGGVMHPDWCPLCRLEKAEEIGSPAAIADWVEQTVFPMLAAHNNIPEVNLKRGMVHQGCSAGDLLTAIRDYEILV